MYAHKCMLHQELHSEVLHNCETISTYRT